MKALLALTVAILVGSGLSLAWRLGVHKDVHLTESAEGPFVQVYAEHVGPYHKIVAKIQEVEAWARKEGVPCPISFGEYFDDPKTVDEDRLKSRGGCLVSEKSASLPMPPGLAVQQRPRRDYVIATFDGAPSIGPYKVYPKAMALIAEKGLVIDGPVMEQYRITSSGGVETRYFFPVKPASNP